MKGILFLPVLLLLVICLTVFVSAEDVYGPPMQENREDAVEAVPETDGNAHEDAFDMSTYFKETVAPAVLIVFSSVCTLYGLAKPALSRFKRAHEKFSSATDGVLGAKSGTEEALAELRDLKETFLKETEKNAETFRVLLEMFEQMMKKYAATIDDADIHAKNCEEILRIGLGNSEELVRRGYAAKIARVGQQNEETN